MPNKNAMWVSATTTAVNTQSNSLSTSGSQPRQQEESINVHEWALLLNKKHRDNTYKGYSADSNGGSYEGL